MLKSNFDLDYLRSIAAAHIQKKTVTRRDKNSVSLDLFLRKTRLKPGEHRMPARLIFEVFTKSPYPQMSKQRFFRLFHKRFKRIKSNGVMYYFVNKKKL